MERLLILVGMERALRTAWSGIPTLEVAVADCDEIEPREDATLVVGRAAALELCPRHVARRYGTVRRRAVLCATALDPAIAWSWSRAGIVEAVAPDALAAWLRNELRRRELVRPVLDLEEWVPRRLSPLPPNVEGMLSAIPGLEKPFRIEDWARSLELSRRTLGRTCLRLLGVTPTEAVRWYVEAVARAVRSQGGRLRHVGAMLGFAHESSISRYLSRIARAQTQRTVPRREAIGADDCPNGTPWVVPDSHGETDSLA